MKKPVKNLISLFLVVFISLSVVACSKNESQKDDKKTVEDSKQTVVSNNPVSDAESDLETLIKKEGKAFENVLENIFKERSGISCDCSIEAQGTSLIIDCKIDGANDVSDNIKGQIKRIFDNQKGLFKTGFDIVKKDAPSLEKIILNICEEDGDIIASIDIKF